MNLTSRGVDELFASLGDPVRLRLACCLLAVPRGACVCELVDALDVSQPNVSRHLKVLKGARLVEERRDGRWMYYHLRPPEQPVLERIRSCLETVSGYADLQVDLRRLRRRRPKSLRSPFRSHPLPLLQVARSAAAATVGEPIALACPRSAVQSKVAIASFSGRCSSRARGGPLPFPIVVQGSDGTALLRGSASPSWAFSTSFGTRSSRGRPSGRPINPRRDS